MSKTSGYSEKAKEAIAKIGKVVVKKTNPHPTAPPEYVTRNWDPRSPPKPEDFEDMPPLKPITPPQKDRPPTLKPKPQNLGTKTQPKPPATSGTSTEALKKTEIKPEAYGTYKEVRGDEELKKLAEERGIIKEIGFSDLRFNVDGTAEEKSTGAEYKYVSDILSPIGDYTANYYTKLMTLRWGLQFSHPLVIKPVAVSYFTTEKSTSLYILYPRDAFEEIIPFEKFTNFSTRVSISLLALLFQLADIFKDSKLSAHSYKDLCLVSTSVGPRFLVPFLGLPSETEEGGKEFESLWKALKYYSSVLGVDFNLSTEEVNNLVATDQLDRNIASIIQTPKNISSEEAIRKCLLLFLNVVKLVNPEDIKKHSSGHPIINVRGKYYGPSRPIVEMKFRKEVRYIADSNFPYKEDYQRRLGKLGSTYDKKFADELMDFGTEVIYRLIALKKNFEVSHGFGLTTGLGSMVLPFICLHLLLLEKGQFNTTPQELIEFHTKVTNTNKNPAIYATYPASDISKDDFAGAHQHLLQRNGFDRGNYDYYFFYVLVKLNFAY